jgi:hypothetical protein
MWAMEGMGRGELFPFFMLVLDLAAVETEDGRPHILSAKLPTPPETLLLEF